MLSKLSITSLFGLILCSILLLVFIDAAKIPKKYDDPLYIYLREEYGPTLADKFFDEYHKKGYSFFVSDQKFLVAKNNNFRKNLSSN